MYYYFLHNLIENNNICASRNCRIFIYGSILFILTYAVLQTIHNKYRYNYKWIVAEMLFVDIIAVGILYRSYYNISLLTDIIDINKSNLKYNTDDHKYTPKDDIDIIEEENIKHEKYEKYINDINSNNIVSQKNKIRSAKIIQNWWKKILYNHNNGKFYKLALEDFNNRL
jgi:hypothetical protein